ncbi:MAG: putative metal-binding motif-containing protein, partial [Acidobacteria bacterium]|nr:putative metal-binding motif-containing protein [Acidobacteriota bacterium]
YQVPAGGGTPVKRSDVLVAGGDVANIGIAADETVWLYVADQDTDDVFEIYASIQAQADADGDGFGTACDCDDANPDTYPGAPEINDGLDNQCAGDMGAGIVDEVTGGTTLGSGEVCWTAQAGATLYQIGRSTASDFSVDCTTFTDTAPCFPDGGALPPPGESFFYAVRTLSPLVGSWGADSMSVERTIPCAVP